MLQGLVITFRFLICGRRFPVTRRCWITWLSRNSVDLLSEVVMGSGGTIRSFESNKYSSTISHTTDYKLMHLHIFLFIHKMIFITKEEAVKITIQKWEWTGHTLRKQSSATQKQALSWSPHHGQCNEGQLRRCKATIEEQAETAVKTLTDVKAIDENIVCWHCFVEPCTPN